MHHVTKISICGLLG